MTIKEVANHLHLDWKTVKAIDKKFLEHDFGQPDLNGLEMLAVDEIAIRRGHRYLTVVLDYVSGRILFVGKDRKADTLIGFFDKMTPEQRNSVKAVAMDMWDPFIKAVKKNSLRPRSYSIYSMSLLLLAASSTESETESTAKPRKKTKPFSRGHVFSF
jgi:transposase